MGSNQTSPAVSKQDTGMTSFNDVLTYLTSYRTNDFFARLISAMPVREVNRPGFMAGVTFFKGHHILLINEEWVQEKLTLGRKGFDEVRATIAHEAMHVANQHIARQIKLARQILDKKEKEKFYRLTNLAADAAVNDLLLKERNGSGPAYTDMHDNPKMWIFSTTLELPSSDLPYEWILSILMDPEKAKNFENKCSHDPKDGPGDPNAPPCPICQAANQEQAHGGAHEDWKQFEQTLSEEELQVLVTQIEQDSYEKVKEAIKEHKRARGTVPGNLEENLENMLKPPEIPWRKVLHRFVTAHRSTKSKRSMERPRKRWAGMGSTLYPGTKRERTFNLVFGVDTSGSMSSDDIHNGLSELQGIQRVDRDITITVIEFDTSIHKEYEIGATDQIDLQVRGRGGTDFNAVFNRAQELSRKGEIDALIVFTDGYAPSPELQYRPRELPVLWCLTQHGQHPCPDYGFEVRRPTRGY